MYAEYSYYTDTYLGVAITSETEFNRLCTRATTYLDGIMGGAVETATESLKMAACSVAEAWQTNEQGGDLQSQSVGSWSKSYATIKPKTNEQRLYDAAIIYLSNSGLISRWV